MKLVVHRGMPPTDDSWSALRGAELIDCARFRIGVDLGLQPSSNR
jgi:hypothetical protein